MLAMAVVALCAASAPFPLPAVDGKSLAVTEKQKVYRLPMGFERVKGFYAERFAKDPEHTLTASGVSGSRILTLVSRHAGDTWKKAVVTEGAMETVVEVTPVMRMDSEDVNGRGTPLVEFVFGRSKEVERAVESIDHLQRE